MHFFLPYVYIQGHFICKINIIARHYTFNLPRGKLSKLEKQGTAILPTSLSYTRLHRKHRKWNTLKTSNYNLHLKLLSHRRLKSLLVRLSQQQQKGKEYEALLKLGSQTETRVENTAYGKFQHHKHQNMSSAKCITYKETQFTALICMTHCIWLWMSCKEILA